MHVVISPDRIGPLAAADVARALAQSWREHGHRVVERPMSDGGAGMVEAIRAARGGDLLPVPVSPAGSAPDGELVPVELLHVRGRGGGTAYVDGAFVLGAGAGADGPGRLLRTGTTAPVADLLLAALATGASRVVLGLGQVAVHDGGRGLLERLTQRWGLAADVSSPPLAALRDRLAGVQVDLASATDLPLLGLTGAGAALAHLPGITPAAAQDAERTVGEYCAALVRSGAADTTPSAEPDRTPGLGVLTPQYRAPRAEIRPSRDYGTGAGGGAAYALALLGARILPGADVVAAEIGLTDIVATADLVVTGTTTLDGSAMHESVVATVGRAAMAVGLPVVALGAQVQTSRRDGARIGVSATYPVVDAPIASPHRGPASEADPWTAMVRRGERIRRTWAQ
ncbi:glycerate kinase [Ruania halotolerans]|uniref:glycerate kinase n=1 Tax=Ruania halotolerans TaxID=2897773 RepID=UPI001E501595|nr:glycerate kinase [Ruania halotolerans]UFU04841.1 glycerate kinase [Ruania halotolerans]